MSDIDALKARYFVQGPDTNLPSEPLPATFTGCRVLPDIDGEAYFDDITTTLLSVGTGPAPAANAGHFIYIVGWWLHLLGGDVSSPPGSVSSTGPTLTKLDPFTLDGPAGVHMLVDILKEKARVGVDVRILGWVSQAVMTNAIAQSSAVSIRDVNIGTLSAIHELRKEPALANKCCLNIIGHTAGAVHCKMVLIGNDTEVVGFTGGLDFVENRHSNDLHTTGSWHDVQARIEGPVTQALYDFFRQMWNEVLTRPVKTFRVGDEDVPTVAAGTAPMPSKALPAGPLGKHHVQALRTVPQFNYTTPNVMPEALPISFAPHGIFEVRTAWRKAIRAAETYIYMEDQAFWSVEVMSWINEVIKIQPHLKVILVTGVADPNDPQLPPFNVLALRDGLLAGLGAAQMDRIRVFGRNVVVHSKTTLIDDHWAMIGSANCMRRSLYTDIEHAIAVLDEDDLFARQYRVELWGGHFNLPPGGRPVIDDLDKALNVWNPAWGSAGSGVTLPGHLGLVTLPPPPVTLTSTEQTRYDRYYDPDSRQDWGGCP